MFQNYFGQEKSYYSTITELLTSYNYSQPPEQQQHIFEEIQCTHKKLVDLQEQETLAQGNLGINKDIFFVNNVNDTLIPVSHINDSLNYLYQHYVFFLDKLLFFEDISTLDTNTIKSYILKIFLEPKGQELIISLNNLKAKNENLKITVAYGENLAVPPKDFASSHKLDQITLKYPRAYHQQQLFLYAGKDTSLSFNVPFIAFAHELIHCLHFWQDNWMRNESFPTNAKSPLFNLYVNSNIFFADKEEFCTIEHGYLCENSIRAEHGISLRGSHKDAALYDHNKMILISFLAQMRGGNTKFSTMYFPNEFKLPMFLDTNELEIPQLPGILISQKAKSVLPSSTTDSYRFCSLF